MLIAANFHYVRERYSQPYPGIHGVTVDEFSRQLDTLAALAPFVGQADLLEAITGGRALPERCWLVTFDDGLREQYEVAWPILKAKGIPAIFYVNTGCIEESRLATVHKIHLLRSQVAPNRVEAAIRKSAEVLGVRWETVDMDKATRQYPYDQPDAARLKYGLNFVLPTQIQALVVEECCRSLLQWDEHGVAQALYMRPEQLKALAMSGALGTHGHEHVPMGLLSEGEIRTQLARSIDRLQAWTGMRVDSLSYPYGSFEACSDVAGLAAKEAGLKFAITMERAGNPNLEAPYFLARCACNDLPGGSSPRWSGAEIFTRIPVAQWRRGRA